MLTLFTIPKSMAGATAVAQSNAFRSWRALGDDVEILLFGDEEGVGEAAEEVAARHVPDIGRNEWGTPLVRDAFAAAAQLATRERLCYANADMILLSDLPAALRRVGERAALVVGRRVDLAVDGELSFGGDGEARLRRLAAEQGRPGTEREIDYMAFPRGVDWQMPPLAVGRPGWDNWMIYRARLLGLAIVDASDTVLAIHQRHGYEHVAGRTGPRWQGPEADRNRALVAEMGTAYGILDASHVLTARSLRPAFGLRHLKRRARRHRLLGRGVRKADALRASKQRAAASRALGAVAWALTRASRRLEGRGRATARTLEGDRDVEWAWTLAHLAAAPGRVLDLGTGNGMLALAAALRGHRVVAIDLEPAAFSFDHSGIDFRQGDFNQLELEPRSFDQVLCCSTIEHVGLAGRYGAEQETDGDLEAAARIARILRPDGTLVLTLPVGQDAVFAPLHRIYGRARLPRLLEPFATLREEYRVKRDGGIWEPVARETALDEEGSESYYALGLLLLAPR
jgi:SAM-dependent methyltransferase